MHKFKIFLGKTIALALLAPTLVTAAVDKINTTYDNPLKSGSIAEMAKEIISVIIQLGIPVAVLFIIYAGFLFVTARGSEEKITKARATLLWAVVGTAILLGAFVIMSAIQGTVDNLKS